MMDRKGALLITGAAGGIGVKLCRIAPTKGIPCIGVDRVFVAPFRAISHARVDLSKGDAPELVLRVVRASVVRSSVALLLMEYISENP